MNGKFYKDGWAILTVVASVIATVSIALLIATNLSPLFLHYPRSLSNRYPNIKLLGDYWRLLAYLQLPWMTRLHLKVLPITFSTVLHFRDVRHLLLGNEFVAVLSSYLVIRLLIKQKQLFQLFRLKELLQLIILIGILLCWLPIVNFNDWFINFHRLLFRNHYWLLNPHQDPIILMLPTSFFIKVFLLAIGISVLLLFSLIGWLKFRTDKPNDCRN